MWRLLFDEYVLNEEQMLTNNDNFLCSYLDRLEKTNEFTGANISKSEEKLV